MKMNYVLYNHSHPIIMSYKDKSKTWFSKESQF